MKIIASQEFSGRSDTWTEYLCIETSADGQVTISSRSNVLLGEVGELLPLDEDGEPIVPEVWKGQRVFAQGGYLFTDELQPHTDESVATFAPGGGREALDWIEAYGWGDHSSWSSIRAEVLAAFRR
jgi:hypothetical protein